jgi:NAD(P)-dependent dehydrogenase (short-subunit alcohol dehydrogenase family)
MANPTPFSGKVIAITGGASGIALATAVYLAERGASLSLADVQADALNNAVSDLQTKSLGKVTGYVVDVQDASAVDSWITATINEFGRLDGAANLAGIVGKTHGKNGIIDQDEDEWNFIIGVNLTGMMHCLRAQMRVIADGGSIVNAASIAGLMGRSFNAAYSVSKHGVIGLTRSAAKEIGDRGVRVNSIAP